MDNQSIVKMDVRITHYTTAECLTSNKPFVLYNIYCMINLEGWNVEKRYSDFEKLHVLLQKKYDVVPNLPPKIYFGNQNTAQLQKRKAALQNYLKDIIGNDKLSKDEHVDVFLEMSKNIEQIKLKNFAKENSDTVEALYDHNPKDETFLPFKRGDKLIVKKRDGTVYYGFCKEDPSRCGFFPSNYVQSVLLLNTIISKTPPAFTPLWNEPYDLSQMRKNRPVGKMMTLAVDFVVNDASDTKFDHVMLKMYDKVEIAIPAGDLNEYRNGQSYIKHIKKHIKFWIADECLWEVPNDTS